jgi:hypothetical protein
MMRFSDETIRKEWSRALRLYGRSSSLAKRIALGIVDDLEKAGVSEADIDRIAKAAGRP